MTPRWALWLALRIVRIAALLVPAVGRDTWLQEWEAELVYQSARVTSRLRPTWRMSMNLVRRALGSLPDAAWLRRQFTLDGEAVHDAVHAVRLLLKAPAFTAIALFVFALGIGATTAMVSITDTLFLRPLPFAGASRIMTIWQVNRATGQGREDVAPGNALDWMARARSFDAIAIAEPRTVDAYLEGREPQLLGGARVSERFFTLFAAPLALGRTFLPAEFKPGGPRAVILSHRLWMTRFGGDSAVLGAPLRLDADTFTIVGVTAAGFELRPFDNRFPEPEPMLWLAKQGVQSFEPTLRGRGYWNVFARLAPGRSVAGARAELATISTQLARERPSTNANVVADVVPLKEHLAGGLGTILPFLLAAAALLLTVACANVANLLLARGVARAGEFAVRQALGASRSRLVRQLLLESLLLSTAGAAVGMGVAVAILSMIARLRPIDAARVDTIPIDARGAVIVCVVTLAAAVAAGLAPALQSTRPAVVAGLRTGGRSVRRGVPGALVTVEIAAAVVLAVGAGLLMRSFLRIQRVDPGFRPADVVALQIFLSDRHDTREKRLAFFQDALGRMRGVPGVTDAGIVSTLPFGLGSLDIRLPLAIGGRPAAAGDAGLVYTTVVGGDYFRAMGIPLLRGRLVDAADTASSPQVVVVSRTAADTLWPGANPIGSKVRTRFAGVAYDAEVVGIVGEVRHDGLDRPARAEVFIPSGQANFGMMTFVIRTAPGTPAPVQALKEQVWAVDPLQTFYATSTLSDLLSRSLTGRRFILVLMGGFALVTLALAAAGVYGVTSFSTAQRTREFGIRMALGAVRRDILGLVIGEGLKLAGVGTVAGVVLALSLAPLLHRFLFDVATADPITLAVVTGSLLAIAATACYVPARRALRDHPVEALRYDS
jgi:putative ABC transport system permease protein